MTYPIVVIPLWEDAVLLDGTTYVPITFTRSIPDDEFKYIAKHILHGYDCVFSKPVKKWFCKKDYIEYVQDEVEEYLQTRPPGIDKGEELARLMQKGE